jgi:hypothetical protein
MAPFLVVMIEGLLLVNHMAPFCYLYISTTACLMNGVCHAEGTNWTSGCVEYTCMLTSAGYRSVDINKGMYYKFHDHALIDSCEIMCIKVQ